MKLTKTARLFYLALTISMTLLLLSCTEGNAPAPDDPALDDIGTLIDESEHFTHFAILIAIADREVPEGEESIMQMLMGTNNQEVYTIFAPSDAVFESLAKAWATTNSVPSVEDVIGEFTHQGQPAKTRQFVLGHIFRTEKKPDSGQFTSNLNLVSMNGVGWKMITSELSPSGFVFVLAGHSSIAYPSIVAEVDLLTGRNGVVHAALIN